MQVQSVPTSSLDSYPGTTAACEMARALSAGSADGISWPALSRACQVFTAITPCSYGTYKIRRLARYRTVDAGMMMYLIIIPVQDHESRYEILTHCK